METGRTLLQEFVIVPLQAALNNLSAFVPSILGALLILVIGGLLAKLIEELIVRTLKLITLDKIAEQIQLAAMLARGGIRRKLSELIGAIVYWIVILAFVMTALNALNLTVAAELFQQIVAFLPNVLAAVFILIVGIFAAAFLAATVRTAASNSGIVQSHLLGQAVQTVMVVFAAVAALQQLKIQFVGEVFLIILGGISLGCALAFGLGCKDLAGRWVNDLIAQLNTKKR
ncbi:MAG: hypothetical protein HY598_00925 [Candidatus Omnitrophica bacterium]|nr:hypothetical protein [Candidatus Omnitrophota bacterium]